MTMYYLTKMRSANNGGNYYINEFISSYDYNHSLLKVIGYGKLGNPGGAAAIGIIWIWNNDRIIFQSEDLEEVKAQAALEAL